MGNITVYTKEGCPYCAKLMGELREKGIAFSEVVVSNDPGALNLVKEKYKADKVPVLVEGERVTIGYKGAG